MKHRFSIKMLSEFLIINTFRDKKREQWCLTLIGDDAVLDLVREQKKERNNGRKKRVNDS